MDESIEIEQPVRRYTLRKGERLRHRTLVNDLYEEGESLYAYPLRLQWRRVSADRIAQSFRGSIPRGIDRVQMMITVPKRRQRHAVDRVQMRRRVREAYRLNRHPLLEAAMNSHNATISLAFIYISDKKCSYHKIEKAMRALLEKLTTAIISD